MKFCVKFERIFVIASLLWYNIISRTTIIVPYGKNILPVYGNRNGEIAMAIKKTQQSGDAENKNPAETGKTGGTANIAPNRQPRNASVKEYVEQKLAERQAEDEKAKDASLEQDKDYAAIKKQFKKKEKRRARLQQGQTLYSGRCAGPFRTRGA